MGEQETFGDRTRKVTEGFRGRAPIAILGLTLSLVFSVGCGAKTGLYTDDGGAMNRPDAPSTDAGPDVMDAGPPPPCVEVPFNGGPVDLDLRIPAVVGRADIAFLIDKTASMGDEIDRIRSELRDRIAPAIRRAIPDSQLAVATFADFPVSPYGASSDTPFELGLPMTSNLSDVQATVNGISLTDGRDVPESQVEALYQLVTGDGIAPYVPPSAGCPRGGLGYACIRPDALPVVLLFTDNVFHNGPGGTNRYAGFRGTLPHTYEQALAELRGIGALVIGFDSGDGVPRGQLQRLATDTGTVTDGRPLVYDIGTRGQALGTSVVEAIETLAGTLIQDVDAQLFDPNPADGVDVLSFVDGIRPVRAEPADGVAGIDFARGIFLEARAGTILHWQLVVRNDAVAPGVRPRRFTIEVRFRGDGRRRLRSEFVDIVVPGADGSGCEGQ